MALLTLLETRSAFKTLGALSPVGACFGHVQSYTIAIDQGEWASKVHRAKEATQKKASSGPGGEALGPLQELRHLEMPTDRAPNLIAKGSLN